MTIQQAIAVLGLSVPYDRETLKKNYRKQMTLAHPDNLQGAHLHVHFSAQEINEAYSLLKERYSEAAGSAGKSDSRVNRPKHWNAEKNGNAFCERDIYHVVHDAEGEKIGDVKIARGKFLWTPDEEFPDFLKSLFAASSRLLDAVDEHLDRSASAEKNIFQGKLLYLLAQQFVDSTKALFDLELDIENGDNEDIFYIPAMLELNPGSRGSLNVGEKIYPLGIKNHRLYVCNSEKENLGYLSYSSDIYSFILTPLFEQHHAQVKLRLSEKQPNEQSVGRRKTGNLFGARSGKQYKNVDMWLKIPHVAGETLPENLNAQIEELLREYAKKN